MRWLHKVYNPRRAIVAVLGLMLTVTTAHLASSQQLTTNGGGQNRNLQLLGSEQSEATGHYGTAVSVLGNCIACHTETPVLPSDHGSTVDMPLTHCRTCHAVDGELSLAGVLPLDHTHALAGFGCADCHGTALPMQEPEMETCTNCHGSLEDLVTATTGAKPTNPHGSPHGSPYAVCSLCHMQHEASENFCATCHDFDFVLP